MRPILLTDRAAIFHGRALDVDQVLPPKSVDLVLTDPPYSEHTHRNLGREKRNDGHSARPELDFPPLTDADITAYARQWVSLCRGWIIVFTDYFSDVVWGRALEAAGGRWVRTGYWIKTNPMPQMTGDRPGVGAESIVLAHADPELADVQTIVIGHAFPPGKGRMQWHGRGRPAVWRGPVEQLDERRQKRAHPNQKPLWLMQELAGLFGKPGAVVLDPFAGSGTTGVACLAADRFKGSETTLPVPVPEGFSFVGVEGAESWCTFARSRLETTLARSAT